MAVASFLVAAGYLLAALVGDVPPFRGDRDPFAANAILQEMPPDFPLPVDAKLAAAGRGAQLPYHLEWTSAEPVSEVADIYRELLTRGAWEMMLEEETSPSYRVRLARMTDSGAMTHWAMLAVIAGPSGSRVSLDFMVTQRVTVTLN